MIVLGNVFAALALVPVAAAANSGSGPYYAYTDGFAPEGPNMTGVYLDGEPVTNVFPYDAQGEPLTDVQLFTDTGQPLRATVEGADGCLDPDGIDPNATVTPRPLPFAQAPALLAPEKAKPAEKVASSN